MRSSRSFLAAAALAASSVSAQWGSGQTAGSPAYNYMYQFPLPIAPVASPLFSENVNGTTIDFYNVTIYPFQAQIYPDLGPVNLVGYNGAAPGPTYYVERYHETVIRYVNNGNVDAAVHLHGSYTHAPWDGWAEDDMQIGQWKDYYYPNSEPARSIWYHDHADGHTAADAYYGQAGVYIIYDPAEDALGLPKDKYDTVLCLSDKIYQANGDLAPPTTNDPGNISFYGDIIQVNEQPWPYHGVEPRKYRLRFFDMSLSRPYSLYFMQPNGDWIDFQVIASDSGLFGYPVSVNELTIAMGERYEVVIDFSPYAGQNITLKNGFSSTGVITEYDNTDEVMMFVVGDSVSDWTNNGDVPSVLNADIQWPESRTTVDHYFNFQMGGEDEWTINGVDFNDANNRVLARPPQGTIELWEVHHTGGPAVHPVHVHMVNLQVVSRTGGTRGLLPYESAGLKDVVLLEPGETVQLLAYYGPWNGVYMFHCHNLVHEDHAMLDAFNTTALEDLGYFSLEQDLADPLDERFAAQDYSDDLFTSDALTSAVLSLASLGAYTQVSEIEAAQSSFYATAGYNGEPTTTASTTVPASSSGYGFAASTYSGAATAASNGAFGESTWAASSPSWQTSWAHPTQSWGVGFIDNDGGSTVSASTTSWGPPEETSWSGAGGWGSGSWGGGHGGWAHWRA